MPLGFGRPKTEDVVSLIATKKYGRAIEVLRAQLKKRGASTTLRKQLADVLVLSGKENEAVALLIPLADQFAMEGFAAKAVSILKKIQKIDPGRREVDQRLARLIEERQREAVVVPLSRPAPAFGMEEIGIEAPPSIDIRVAPPLAAPLEPAAEAHTSDDGTDLDIDLGHRASISAAASEPGETPPPPEGAAGPAPPREPAAPVSPPELEPRAPASGPALDEAASTAWPLDREAPSFLATSPDATLPLSSAPALAGADAGVPWIEPDPVPEATNSATSDEIEDYDLLYVPDDGDDEEETEVDIDIELPAADAPEEVMSDGAFADELMGLVDSMFQESSEGTAEPSGPRRSGEQIVVSPLFRDFSVDEMVAVIAGLKLLSFERGEAILREGQPGASLFMLTSGRVRAFRKDPRTSKQVKLADLTEGAFFGEMSILTGQPRMASIVALNDCELLELDRPTLDEITKSHPHVWDVLREFAQKRSTTRG